MISTHVTQDPAAPLDAAAVRERLLAAAVAGPATPGLIGGWQALVADAPAEGVTAWFAVTRALGRHRDAAAMRRWVGATRTIAVAAAPDKLRVERYVDLFLNAYARELRDWRWWRRLFRPVAIRPVSARQLPTVSLACTVGTAIETLREDLARPGSPGAADAIGSRRVLLAQTTAAPVASIPAALRALRDAQFARLGWSPDMPRAGGWSELLDLRQVRFVGYRHDHRGGIVFEGDGVVPSLCNEHYMLDMIGHAPLRPGRRRLPLAFAPVSACPGNHYHELVDTFGSLVFHGALPPDTPIVVPRRYETLRPLYEARGIAWAQVADYAEMAETVFDRVIAPAGDASRVHHPSLFRGLADGMTSPGQPRDRLVYLSRSRLNQRRLANEAEIEALARRHGFEVVHPQALSFAEQRRILSEAAIILGPHGAAFTNVLMAPRGALVIEIKCPDYKVPVTLEMASENGLDYLPLVGTPFTDPAAGDFSWRIDPALVDHALGLARQVPNVPRAVA